MSKSPNDYNREEMRSEHFTRLTRFWQAHHGLLTDGKCGPLTSSTLVDEQPSKLAHEVLLVLRAEYGHGESDGFNNSGADIARYRRIDYVPGQRIRGASRRGLRRRRHGARSTASGEEIRAQVGREQAGARG
jgi:hypothetical protein